MIKMVVILTLLINGEITHTQFPFKGTISECFNEGDHIMKEISEYRGPGPNQGWYLKDGNGIFVGFYCE
jgi:hypothetical protein